MIEDASVGISMLRMVSVVFIPETIVSNIGTDDERVPIPDSPYLRWLRIVPSGHGSHTQYLVQICVDVNYYAKRIPPPLKNQAPVRFYPVLYQMGKFDLFFVYSLSPQITWSQCSSKIHRC